jgi:hypothetical protein
MQSLMKPRIQSQRGDSSEEPRSLVADVAVPSMLCIFGAADYQENLSQPSKNVVVPRLIRRVSAQAPIGTITTQAYLGM